MFRKFMIAACLAATLSACAGPLNHNGKSYPTYGVFNEDTNRSKFMCYETSVGGVILAIILVETVVVPVYIVGWSLFYPVGPKDANGQCGTDVDNTPIDERTPTN